MQDHLKIALIQSDLVWENPTQNRANFTEKLNQITDEVDIILLPEMFSSAFTMQPEGVAETMKGNTIKWMCDMAAKKNAAIGGSLVIKENENYYNRFVFVTPQGTIETYDKRHLLTLFGEDKEFTSGLKRAIVNYKGWKICLLICYDLRFPVWSRNVEDYELLIYVANWPKPRISAWDALLKARAIENMSYCIGINRVGLDVNKHEYPGHSAVYNSLGELLTNIEDYKEQTEIVSLSKKHLKTIREKLKFLNDRDHFTLK